MDQPVKGEITASEATKISETNRGAALSAELEKVYAKIGMAAKSNQTEIDWNVELSQPAQRVLGGNGFLIKDDSFFEQRELEKVWRFKISW